MNTTTGQPRILFLEDIPANTEVMERLLRRAGIACVTKRVDTRDEFTTALGEFRPDVVLADYKLPGFNGAEALQIVRARHPEIPFIVVSGILGDEAAIELLKAGAKDYVLKDNLARLAPAVQRVISMEQGIRARKAAEQALRESEERLRALTEHSSDVTTIVAADGKIVFDNPSITRLLGYAPGELLGRSAFELVHPDDHESTHAALAAVLSAPGVVNTIEHRLRHKEGGWRTYETKGTFLPDVPGIQGIVVNARDVTERKKTEQALQRVNRALKTLSAGNEVLVHIGDEPALLRAMCRVIVESGGYRMAWAGYAEQDAPKSIRAVAHYGPAEGYVENLRLTWDEADVRGRGPAGTAIRTHRPVVVHDISMDPLFAPWREAALNAGLGSSIALPLLEGGNVLGSLQIYAAEPNAFDKEEIALLTELATDLAYGIMTLRTRRERLRSEERLRGSLVGTIRAIALTVEKRDPYTAGHQNNVAQLCVAIGRELGWSEDRLEGLRLGATIHDIGKIYIPSEILNRPGKLTSPEFEMIKSHPEVGYDIIKDVDFPWPVAEMIVQHHERLDGTGYPKGLKAEVICLEARILSVADVVEAMSSHRPYRPAVGVDKALAEIVMHRGTRYDSVVVNACVKVLKEGRVRFDQA
jgi:PAS domain S-box-containing protein